MSTPSSSAEKWPADAVPEKWVAALFTRMHRMWGNTFVDKWREVEIDGVKVEWAKALRKLSTAELKAGVDGLLSLKYPPNLPEFYALCKARRLVEVAAEGPRIEDKTKADPVIVEANMRRMREALKPLMQPKVASAEWAYKLLMRGAAASGGDYPYGVVKCASDAITSSAGRLVIENCLDPELKAEYTAIRNSVIEGYRAKGMKLWETP